MESLYYVGLDVHKKTVSYCAKTAAGEKVGAGSVAANRGALSAWGKRCPVRGSERWKRRCSAAGSKIISKATRSSWRRRIRRC